MTEDEEKKNNNKTNRISESNMQENKARNEMEKENESKYSKKIINYLKKNCA